MTESCMKQPPRIWQGACENYVYVWRETAVWQEALSALCATVAVLEGVQQMSRLRCCQQEVDITGLPAFEDIRVNPGAHMQVHERQHAGGCSSRCRICRRTLLLDLNNIATGLWSCGI